MQNQTFQKFRGIKKAYPETDRLYQKIGLKLIYRNLLRKMLIGTFNNES